MSNGQNHPNCEPYEPCETCRQAIAAKFAAGPPIAVFIGREEETVYVTRRNLLALLAKLDRNRVTPGDSQCTLVKRDTTHQKYPCTSVTNLVALEDADYYTDRPAGDVYPTDVPALQQDACRKTFEAHIQQEVDAGIRPQLGYCGYLRRNAWPLFERGDDGKGESYLDLYLSHRWHTWKACWYLVQQPEAK